MDRGIFMACGRRLICRIGSKSWASGTLKEGDLIKMGSTEVQVLSYIVGD
jgi:hypothetical protein